MTLGMIPICALGFFINGVQNGVLKIDNYLNNLEQKALDKFFI